MNAAGVPDGTWLGAQEQKENENAEDPIVVDEERLSDGDFESLIEMIRDEDFRRAGNFRRIDKIKM